MGQQNRYSQHRWRSQERDRGREANWGHHEEERSLSDRDHYETGGEQRFNSDREPWGRGESSFSGDRRYARGGYAEETGYRPEASRERDDYGQQRSGYPYPGSGRAEQEQWQSGAGTSGRNPPRRRSEEFTNSPYGRMGRYWDNDSDGDTLFGTGRQGGTFGTAAGTRATNALYEANNQSADFYGRSAYGNRPDSYREPWMDRSTSSYGTPPRYGSGDQDFYGRSSQSTQSHRGRGPKGYQRTDERLKELICETLMEDPDIDASEVDVEVSGGVATLSGSVTDRPTKYRIEDAVERIGGITDINNQLRVQRSGADTSSDNRMNRPGGSQSSASTGRRT